MFPYVKIALSGLEAFWLPVTDSKQAVVLFHGCQHGGSDWFELPEEQHFVSQATELNYSVLAVTTPTPERHGCWPNDEADHLKNVGEAVRDFGYKSIICVGGSSGGTFAARLAQLGYCNGLGVYISPTSLSHREAQDIQGNVAFVYMPKDTHGSSRVEALAEEMKQAGVNVRTWKVYPRPLEDIPEAETLRNVGLLDEQNNVTEDPRQFPWREILRKKDDKILEEMLNRSWAQHEFAGDYAREVLEHLKSPNKEEKEL